jgi:hypothetical protein
MSSIKDFGNDIVSSAGKLKNNLKNIFTSATDVVTNPIEDIKLIKTKNEEIKIFIEEADEKINPVREETNKKLEELGKIKIDIISTTLEEFVQNMEAIENLPFTKGENSNLDAGKSFNFSQQKLHDIQISVVSIKGLIKNSLEATATGAISAGALYTAVAALGVASTGTSVAGLSGLAASNTTLAWLGGSALAVGGGGMALGTIVLGGLAIIPALSYMAWRGKFNYKNELKAVEIALMEAKQYSDNASIVINKFNELSKFINNTMVITQKYNTECIKLNKQTANIRLYIGDNYSKYTQEQQLLIQKNTLYVEGLLKILNTPILNEDGSIHKEIMQTMTYSNHFFKNADEVVFIDFKKKKSTMGLLILFIVIILGIGIAFYIANKS